MSMQYTKYSKWVEVTVVIAVILFFLSLMYLGALVGPSGDDTVTTVDNDLDGDMYKFTDSDEGVTCYIHEHQNQRTMSCVSVNENT